MTTNQANIGAELDTLGWRQGSPVPPTLFPTIARSLGVEISEGADLAIVISQDCDIINRSPEKEPYLEVIRARRVPKKDGNLVHGKNPRRLHMDITIGGVPGVCDLSIHDRVRVPREEFRGLKPDPEVAIRESDVPLLARWIGARYDRAAFPTAFVERLPHGALRKIAKDHGHDVTAVYVQLNTFDELAGGTPYRLMIWATVRPDVFADQDKLLEVEQQFFDPFVAAIKQTPAIIVHAEQLLSEAQVTLADLKLIRKLDDWDYLSVGGDT